MLSALSMASIEEQCSSMGCGIVLYRIALHCIVLYLEGYLGVHLKRENVN